jgi:parallel beta-helix repeat protein
MMLKLLCLILIFDISFVIAGTIDVKLPPYDAVGNGIADDTSIIQSAIEENPGSEILLKNGIFKITNSLTLKSGRTLIGENGTLLYSSSGITMINCQSDTDILNLKINGNDLANRGIVIPTGVNNVTISNCELFNFAGNGSEPAYGIRIYDSSDISIVDTIIHDIDGGGDNVAGNIIGANRAIMIGCALRTLIDRCEIYNIGPWEDGDGIHVQTTGMADVTISNSTFYNFMKRAIKIQASGVVVTNNLIFCDYDQEGVNSSHSGISLYSSSNCEISNNIIMLKRAFAGIQLYEADETQVVNNYVDIYGYYTISRTSAIRPLHIFNSNDCTITDNTLLNYYAYSAIINSFRNTIVNNYILNGVSSFFWFQNCTSGDNTVSGNIDYSTILSGFWRFNDTSDTNNPYDFSTHTSSATSTNCTYATGRIGGALQFNGEAPSGNSFVNLSSYNLQLKANTSMALWVKSDNPVGYNSMNHPYYPGIFSSNSNGSFDNYISLGKDSIAGYARVVYEDQNGAIRKSNTFPYATGDWVHITIVMNASCAPTFYINGEWQGDQSSSAPIDLSYLGCGYGGAYNDGALKGKIDEFMYFDEALSAETVNNIYLKHY